ncbi:MAG: hypothetical protein ACLP0J_04700 [Solirubrobacteraceae bacterium]
MAAEPTTHGVIARASAVERGPLVMAARNGLFDASAEPELDRWTAALRSLTCARLAAFSLLESGHVLVKSLCTKEGAAEESARLELSESLEEHLIAKADLDGSIDPTHAYLEVPVTVGAQLLGWMSVVGNA